MPKAPPAEYEAVSHAAARLGIHPDTLRVRIAAGDLDAYRMGTSSRPRVRVADVDALMRPVREVAVDA